MNDRPRSTTARINHRVLVVDDDRDFADTLSRLLTLEGYDVRHAYSVSTARDTLDGFAAEVALIDIRMGERSGLSLIAECQRRQPEITCIMMTAYASAETAIEALQEGAYDYLCKPFYTEDLVATLERCFERIILTRSREQAEAALRRRNRDLEELNARLQKAVGSMQALSTHLTIRELCNSVLEELVGEMGGQRGVICLMESGQLVIKHGLGPGHASTEALPVEVESLFQEVLKSRQPAVARMPGGGTGAAAEDDSLLAFPLIGEQEEPAGVVAILAGGNRAFTQQDHEIGQILVSFASEAIRLVKALESLTWSEERLRAIIDNSPSLISLMDLDGHFIVVNRRFEEWHVHKRDDVVGMTAQDLFPEDIARRYAAKLDAVRSRGQVVDEEIELPFADGTRHSVLVTKFPVLGADGQPMGIGMIGTDVTDHRRAQEQLRQAQKMEALGQLTGGIAHDFNNLLAVISGNLDLIKDQIDDASDLAELVEDALSAAHNGAELTDRLLAFGRRQMLHPQVTDAGRLVQGMSRLLARTLGETIEIRKVLSDVLWPVEIDRNQLETSLLNLAINARDALPGGGMLTIETANATLGRDTGEAHDAVVPGPYVLISVTDNGTGMPPETMERAMQPFFTTKEAEHGSGLGLSMVYGFVKQSGGHMEIASALGRGTTVKLYLPKTAKPALDGERPAHRPTKTAGRGERILVVEDKPDVRKLARRILTGLGYDVLEAPDAKTALEILDDKRNVDLLFTDVVLPGPMSGIHLAREAQGHDPRLKVLYTSGYAQRAAPRGDPPGNDITLIKKPFVKEGLARMVRQVLDSDGA